MQKKTRNTMILLAVVLLLSGGIWAAGRLSRPSRPSHEAVVSVDGKETAVYSLQDRVEIDIPGFQGGRNHLVIRDGAAVITEADCPDGRCTKMGPISEIGEWMVCMPHRVTVTIR